MNKLICAFGVLAVLAPLSECWITGVYAQDILPYKNPQVPVEERVDDLLGRMTLEEKFWQMFMIPGDLSDGKERYTQGIFGFQVSAKGQSNQAAGQLLDYQAGGNASMVARQINDIQRFFIEESRLGIPIILYDEALHGLVRTGATSFPAAIALAATWDTALVADVARAIMHETKSRGIRQILSPVLNIARDVRWGRTEETYGEDPYLTSQMALAFISQFEKANVITTPKHFVANVGAGGRDSYPIHYNERELEEVYFPAFKSVFKTGGARSVMTAYNSLDGTPCTSNSWLLNKKLKNEWGFNGFVISDAGATGGANVLHFTAANYAEATEDAIEGGLDVIFQTSYDHYPLFWEAYEKGMIDQKDIDESVRRILRAKFDLGLFENPYVDEAQAEFWNGHSDHRRLAELAAVKSAVLLKNDGNILPLDKHTVKVAFIGSDAAEARLGGYSGPGNNKVSILDAVKSAVGEDRITYAEGCGRKSDKYTTIPSANLFTMHSGGKTSGLRAEYYNNIQLEGEATVQRIDKQIQFGWTLFSPAEEIPYDWYSIRWTGKLVGPANGAFNIGIEGNDGYRLWIDGKLIIDNWVKRSFNTVLVPFDFASQREYDVRLEYFESAGNARFRLVWDAGIKNDWQDKIAEAVEVARNSDVAVIVAGIEEGEFRDRALLSLPGHQEALITAVAQTGKPVVVVLTGGSAITMTKWIDDVESILMAWYPGEVGGNAVSALLFGDANPSGKLPITFPVSEAQLPLYYNHKPTGRGDNYLNMTGEPLFPFGYGLSYTEFVYSNLRIEKKQIRPGEVTKVNCTVRNIGTRQGEEVVQLYIRDVLSSVSRPVTELKGFQRLALDPGEEQEVEFQIDGEQLSMLDAEMRRVVEPGDFRIMIGRSCKDIRLRSFVQVLN